MATSGKVVVIGMVATAVLVTAALGPERAERIRELARVDANIHEIRAEGAVFAEGRDADACLTEALARGPSTCDDGDLPCAAIAGLFYEGCLGALVLPLSFCDAVPAPDPQGKAAERATDAFLAEVCAEHGHPGSVTCARVVHDGLLRTCDRDAPLDEDAGQSAEIEEF